MTLKYALNISYLEVMSYLDMSYLISVEESTELF